MTPNARALTVALITAGSLVGILYVSSPSSLQSEDQGANSPSPSAGDTSAVTDPHAGLKADPHAGLKSDPHADPHAMLRSDKSVEDPAAAEAVLLGNTRQLTFEGRRSGEGYFSADGSKMIFQSEREPGNPFYQIYLMDLETGDVERISPGTGKTTCAWIHPDGKRVMFASTQDDPNAKKKQDEEIAMRESGTARKYSWDYDELYEIYEYDLDSGVYTNVTKTLGYDAEGSYSPDGEWIAFASNRQAYEGELSEEDAKWFETNKSFLMELYLMRADGSEVRRLTHADGYDGGPFFSADGKQVCWRRFDRKGLTAEIFSMDLESGEERQLTKLGAMSWAPYFHPSGEYLVFATNRHGFANFELYLVAASGEGEPVRVTYTEGFDGLPAFAPDGETLTWTSTRTAEKRSQIFLAKWNHEKARELLGLDGAPAKPSEALELTALGNAPDLTQTQAAVAEADLEKHIGYLASEELEGRMTGTAGNRAATAYVAAAFESYGLEPAGDDDTFFHSFEFTAGVELGGDNKMTLSQPDGTEKALEVEKDWLPIAFSENGEVASGEIAFAGYGLELKAGTGADGTEYEQYSSYFHLDVKDKWVMVLRFSPEDVESSERRRFAQFASLRHKALKARQKSAKGIIFVSGPNSNARNELVPLRFDASLADSAIPAISLSTEQASRLLAAAGQDLQAIQDKLDGGEMVAGFTLPDVQMGGTVDVRHETRTGRNVIGRIPASLPYKERGAPVLIGAHVDHLGSRAGRGSLATDDEREQIHYGADDNASGTAALMEIAQWLADMRAEGKFSSKRDVLFAAWSGEEIGLLGSSAWIKDFADLATGDSNGMLTGKLAAALNMDMVGRLDKNLIVQGVGSSSAWRSEIERRNAPIGLPLILQDDTYVPTDASTFYLRGVPILSAWTGAHGDYHTPRDTVDKINFAGTEDVARFMGLMTRGLAIAEDEPDYLKVEPPKNRGRGGFRVYLGTQPDYTATEIEGVKLTGVAAKGPADKAGLKGGDVIVQMDGKEVKNIYDMTYVMGEMKPGVTVKVEILRNGEKVELSLTPESRE